MKKKYIFLSLMLVLGIGMAQAQTTAYVYVKQYNANDNYKDGNDGALNSANLRADSVVSNDGVATFNVATAVAVMKFEDGDGIMKIGDNTVARLPITVTNKGALVADFDNESNETVADVDANGYTTKTITVTSAGYATFCSPFLAQVSSNDDKIKMYAPVFNATSRVLDLNDETSIDDATIIPIGKAVVLKGVGDITFKYINSTASTRDDWGAVEGTTLFMNKPSATGKTVYTLGYNADKTSVGFYTYLHDIIPAGKSYLFVSDAASGAKSSFISFFESIATGMECINGEQEASFETAAYNMMGQRVKANTKGLIIVNGEKFINK